MPMSLLDAAQKELEKEGKPLHYRDLTDRVVDSGLWRTAGKTPERTLSSLLGNDIRQREASGELVELLIQNAESLKEAAEADGRDDLGGVVVERKPIVLLNLPQSTAVDVDGP